jgi:B12-binding domain/radical SAM domain protein
MGVYLQVRLTRQTDLVLLHPPSVYDFREKLIVPSPIADLVPSSPVFEMYPIGFSFLGEYLERHGMQVRVVNLAARMLEQPSIDVERLIKNLRPRAFGISLHWLPHCHGAVEIARLCKRAHPDTPVIMGGYSASIFHQELLAYPEVDYVVRGDSAEEPLLGLMRVLGRGGDLWRIPNLSYRDPATGVTVENRLDYVPADLNHLGANYVYMVKSALRHLDWRGVRAFKGWWSYPMTAVLTCKGCMKNCTFCGGSAWSMARCFGRRGVALRSAQEVARDIETISKITGAPVFVIGDIMQPGAEYAWELLERLARVAPRNHIVLELFEPAPREFFERLGSALPNFDLEISPESHDEGIRRLAGKHYTNEQLESNLAWALENGCGKFDVFFMIGIEGQAPASVAQTVSYCASLLDDHGTAVNPLIGPLAPFLDPGSINQARAEEHGYRVLLQTLEDHREALLEPHWRDLLGYETRWMTRQDIVDTTYSALLELNRVKADRGQITAGYATAMERFLSDSIKLLGRLDMASATEDPAARRSELALIKWEADALRARADLVKEELEWPIEGGRFHYAAIARMALKRKAA